MKNKEDKIRDISFCKIIKILLPMVMKKHFLYISIFLLIDIIIGVSMGANTLAMQKFFDSVALFIQGDNSFKNVINALILVGIIVIGFQVIQCIANFMGSDLPERIRGNIGSELNLKSARLNPLNFENPKFLDDINKAKIGLKNSIVTILILFLIVTTYIPYFIFMSMYLYNLKPILSISVVLIFIPVFLSQFIRIKVFSKLEDNVAPIRREYEYYESCIIDREFFKETRILGGFSYFKRLYKIALNSMNENIWNSEKKAGLIELCLRVITLMGYAGVLVLVILALLDNSISVGAFGAVFVAIDTMFDMMEEVICTQIAQIAKNIGTVKNFIRYLELEERKGQDVDIKSEPEITLENISFTYPLAKEKTLNRISLCIHAGETIAIVGENGAGKSTLVKIITGIYVPTEGNAFIDRSDLSCINYNSLYKIMSAVFQKYQKYKMTLGENISISNRDIKDDVKKNEMLNYAINKAEINFSKAIFTKGFDTILAKEFDGIDLSGGEWQRIALARGFYKDCNMIVLDEPTASIDPIEETKIYKKFKEISNGKTSVIVTHRLGAAQIADRIVVMDKGKVVQVGTNEELIVQVGKYKEMYEAQSKWYSAD